VNCLRLRHAGIIRRTPASVNEAILRFLGELKEPPTNPFALAATLPSSSGRFLTGIFGTEVVALDAETGAVGAATLGGWTCDPANPPAVFDGSFRLERLPGPRSYKI
jgi:hypothetical protein